MNADLDRLFVAGLVLQEFMAEEELGRALARWYEQSSDGIRTWFLQQKLISQDDLDEFDSVVVEGTGDIQAPPAEKQQRFDALLSRTLASALAVAKHPIVRRILLGDESAAAELPVASLGRFRVQKVLGKGGLGEIWLATDEQLDREVALKRMRRDRSPSSQQIARFQREAHLAGKLQHPNIVPVYHFGYSQVNGEPFFAMPLVDGRTLEAVIAEYYRLHPPNEGMDRFEFNRLISYFVRVGEAISFAHSKGILHRDLKPANVMVGELEQVFVLDWGLAKFSDSVATDNSAEEGESAAVGAVDDQTQGGAILGSPLYMSPEQAMGRIETIGPHTDIYGLGAILYVILTGKPPHPKGVMRLPQDHLRTIATTEVTPAREINGSCPRSLEAIAAKAMALDPSSRYQSASDLLEDIHRWQAGESISARRETRRERIVRFARHHQSLTQGVAMGLMILLVSTLMFLTRSLVMESQFSLLAFRSDTRHLLAIADLTISNARWLATSAALAAENPPAPFAADAPPKPEDLSRAASEFLSDKGWLFQHNPALAQLSVVDQNGHTIAWLARDAEQPAINDQPDLTHRGEEMRCLLDRAAQDARDHTAIGIVPPVLPRPNEQVPLRRIVAASWFADSKGNPAQGAVVAEMAMEILYAGEALSGDASFLYLLDENAVPLFDPYRKGELDPLLNSPESSELQSQIESAIRADMGPNRQEPFWSETGEWLIVLHQTRPSIDRHRLNLFLAQIDSRRLIEQRAIFYNAGLLLFMFPSLLIGVAFSFYLSSWISRLDTDS